jgi:GNAT superfamily N-acetyltransferase
VHHALRADLADVVEVWVDAFTSDPYLRWIQPDDERWPAFGRAWLSFIAELAFERGHTYIAGRAGAPDVAVAWIPPDLSLVGPDDLARGREILVEHAGESRAADAFTTIIAARAHALAVPHWTLQYIGVRAARHGQGVGAAAVAPLLALCDEERLPCGLVSTNPRNVSFYERHGFRTAAQVATPDGAATIRPMERMPAPAR